MDSTKISVPRCILKHNSGFSLDIGGTLAKIAILEDNDRESKNVTVCLKTFPRTEEGAIKDYIIRNVQPPQDNEWAERQIITTGIGMRTSFRRSLESEYGTKSSNINEFECFANTFYYMWHHLSKLDIFMGPSQQVTDEITKRQAMLRESYSKAIDKSEFKPKNFQPDNVQVEETDSQDVFPCVLHMVGSAMGSIKVGSDGSFKFVDGSDRGGRAFAGMGSLLTGSKTFEELANLAESGNSAKVDTLSGEIMSDGEDDIYSEFPKDFPCFMFGKAVDKTIDDFSRADLARALLGYTANDIAHSAVRTAEKEKCKHIFFCGNFFNKQVFKDEVARQCGIMTLYNPKLAELKIHFLKYGGHMGAVGALFKEVLLPEYIIKAA